MIPFVVRIPDRELKIKEPTTPAVCSCAFRVYLLAFLQQLSAIS